MISIGYGNSQGTAHKTKTEADVSSYERNAPDWFHAGGKAALPAPTAMNRQKFKITGNGRKVSLKAGLGFYMKIDLGIVKYHFDWQ